MAGEENKKKIESLLKDVFYETNKTKIGGLGSIESVDVDKKVLAYYFDLLEQLIVDRVNNSIGSLSSLDWPVNNEKFSVISAGESCYVGDEDSSEREEVINGIGSISQAKEIIKEAKNLIETSKEVRETEVSLKSLLEDLSKLGYVGYSITIEGEEDGGRYNYFYNWKELGRAFRNSSLPGCSPLDYDCGEAATTVYVDILPEKAIDAGVNLVEKYVKTICDKLNVTNQFYDEGSVAIDPQEASSFSITKNSSQASSTFDENMKISSRNMDKDKANYEALKALLYPYSVFEIHIKNIDSVKLLKALFDNAKNSATTRDTIGHCMYPDLYMNKVQAPDEFFQEYEESVDSEVGKLSLSEREAEGLLTRSSYIEYIGDVFIGMDFSKDRLCEEDTAAYNKTHAGSAYSVEKVIRKCFPQAVSPLTTSTNAGFFHSKIPSASSAAAMEPIMMTPTSTGLK